MHKPLTYGTNYVLAHKPRMDYVTKLVSRAWMKLVVRRRLIVLSLPYRKLSFLLLFVFVEAVILPNPDSWIWCAVCSEGGLRKTPLSGMGALHVADAAQVL
jgi:hypothetical protein